MLNERFFHFNIFMFFISSGKVEGENTKFEDWRWGVKKNLGLGEGGYLCLGELDQITSHPYGSYG